MSMNLNTTLGSNIGGTGGAFATSNDPNNPAAYLNSAYQAFKFNPGATQQAVQAAGQAEKQGQPTDLRGLAALAALQGQQKIQQAQLEKNAQAQGMPPTVLQQLIQSSGIMGQLPQQMAQGQQPAEQQGLGALQPDATALPDDPGMAAGGLVALAQGGEAELRRFYAGKKAGLDDPEVDTDEFWADEEYNAGPDIGGFLQREVYEPTKQEIKNLRNLAGADVEKFHSTLAERAAAKDHKYYDTTEPSPSKRREMAGQHPTVSDPNADKKALEQLDRINSQPFNTIAPTPKPAESLPPPTPQPKATPTTPTGVDLAVVGGKLNDPLQPKEIPAGHANVKGTDEHGYVKTATAEVHPEATKITKELQPTVIQDNSTIPNGTTTADPKIVETELRVKVASTEPGTEAHNNAQRDLDKHLRRIDDEAYARELAGETAPSVHPAAHQEGIGSLAPGESLGMPDRRPRGFAPDQGPTGIEGELAALEAMRGSYQLPPEIMEQLQKNVSGAKEDKWLMALTGLGAGFLGSNSPFKTQALGQGIMSGLGMYGRGAGEEDQAKQQLLAAQMAQAKAPYDAHTQAVNDLIRMQESRGKLLSSQKEKQFEWGAREKMNQDRIRSNQTIAEKNNAARIAVAKEKGATRQMTESQMLHAVHEAEQDREISREGYLKSVAATGVPTVQDVAEANKRGEAAFRRRLGPYYDQVMAYTGGGVSAPSAPVQTAQGNSLTRGLVTPAGLTPLR